MDLSPDQAAVRTRFLALLKRRDRNHEGFWAPKVTDGHIAVFAGIAAAIALVGGMVGVFLQVM